MGLQKVAFDFIVRRSGKLTKSFLCTKPQNIKNISIKDLKYLQTYGDTFESTNPLLDFYRKHKSELKQLVTDKKGNFIYKDKAKTKLVEISQDKAEQLGEYTMIGDKYYREVITSKGNLTKINIDNEYKIFAEDLGVLEHGTSEEAYNSIIQNGFNLNDKNFAETFHGIYFTRQLDGINRYGERKIFAKINGDIACGDANKISQFIHSENTELDKYLKSCGTVDMNSSTIKEMLLKEEFTKRGYVGFYSPQRALFAKCKPVVIFNPNDIEIIK